MQNSLSSMAGYIGSAIVLLSGITGPFLILSSSVTAQENRQIRPSSSSNTPFRLEGTYRMQVRNERRNGKKFEIRIQPRKGSAGGFIIRGYNLEDYSPWDIRKGDLEFQVAVMPDGTIDHEFNNFETWHSPKQTKQVRRIDFNQSSSNEGGMISLYVYRAGRIEVVNYRRSFSSADGLPQDNLPGLRRTNSQTYPQSSSYPNQQTENLSQPQAKFPKDNRQDIIRITEAEETEIALDNLLILLGSESELKNMFGEELGGKIYENIEVIEALKEAIEGGRDGNASAVSDGFQTAFEAATPRAAILLMALKIPLKATQSIVTFGAQPYATVANALNHGVTPQIANAAQAEQAGQAAKEAIQKLEQQLSATNFAKSILMAELEGVEEIIGSDMLKDLIKEIGDLE